MAKTGLNAYLVWHEEAHYEITVAAGRTQAKLQYECSGCDIFTEGKGLHCHLIERDVECSTGEEYEKSRHYDLIFAGITHPDWAQERMVEGWWYHEAGENGYE